MCCAFAPHEGGGVADVPRSRLLAVLIERPGGAEDAFGAATAHQAQALAAPPQHVRRRAGAAHA